MVETLAEYPSLHHTFNLVPSLVEQLEQYAAGDFVDVYWEHTMKAATDLDLSERRFVVERMCELSEHPRARSHPRYLELAHKRDAHASQGWDACARAFTVDEIRDLQIWFNLAWFDPKALESEPLAELVRRGRDYRESDKDALARTQADILVRVLPAYRDAALRGQVEISTSPYFHPILPLLANTDLARVATGDIRLPPRGFAHREDAEEQVRLAVAKHETVFGAAPAGMWCSEQAVGEEVIPLLVNAGIRWTISDETVLARSISGVSGKGHSNRTPAEAQSCPLPLDPRVLYAPHLLQRDGGELAIVFRDHTLSDLIGFAYQSWDSKDAAANLLSRLRELRTILLSAPSAGGRRGHAGIPLVTIALDGENAWEYYPRDGRDFLNHLYEGLSSDPSLRCVTVSEHLRESPPTQQLNWLHTGSWIGGDLRTWIGDDAHATAWDLLHEARDRVARRRSVISSPYGHGRDSARAAKTRPTGDPKVNGRVEEAWRHILVAEGSDWFWWFGEHHHTELDYVWDLNFRRHLQEAYQLLGETVPVDLFLPILGEGMMAMPTLPLGPIYPLIDGVVGSSIDSIMDEWASAGVLAPEITSTMQRAEGVKISEVRYGWHDSSLCLLVVPGPSTCLSGLELELLITQPPKSPDLGPGENLVLTLALGEGGDVTATCARCPELAEGTVGVWKDVVEVSVPLGASGIVISEKVGLVLRIGRDGMTEYTFRSARLISQGG